MKTQDFTVFRYAFNTSRNCYVAWPWDATPLTRGGYDPQAVCAEGQTARECVGKLPEGSTRHMVCGPVRDELIDGRAATWREENGKTFIIEPEPIADTLTAHLAVIRHGKTVRAASWQPLFSL